jgi:hypothetical protein
MVMDQLVGQIARQALLAQPVAGNLSRLEAAQPQAVADRSAEIKLAGLVGMGARHRLDRGLGQSGI